MKRFYVLIAFLCCFYFASAKASDHDVTLKQMIGQMLLVGFQGSTLQPNDPIVQAILKQEVGSVILFDYNFKSKTYDHNIKNPEQLKKLTKQLQAYTKQAAEKNHNDLTPLLISIDYEGGKVNRLSENYGFPKTLSAENVGKLSKADASMQAETMAKTLKDAGINLNFAPVVDVNTNPDNPIIGKLGRSFSPNVQSVIDYAAIFSKAYQQEGVLCSYKHFPGHGSSTGDTHVGFVDVTATWNEKELTPYKELLSKKYSCPLVMIAHVVDRNLDPKGYPASLSYAITTKLLRDKLNFKGVIVTDDMQMKAITNHYGLETAVRLAINAGADIIGFGNQLVSAPQDPKQLVNMIYADVKAGKIPESRIRESYQRIMALKQQLRSY